MSVKIFHQLESNVRFYCRDFPVVFNRAKGSILHAENGRSYIDFFSGAGALNYGHNNEYIKRHLIDYLQSDSIIHGLDFYTSAKRIFLKKFKEQILDPKGFDYKVQFCGPTGTNGVEAALKLARKVKKRPNIMAFTRAYHGMTLGSLAVSGGRTARAGAGVPLGNVTFIPYPDNSMTSQDSIGYIENLLSDGHSGVDKPAAIILETVQAEGGVNVAPIEWLRQLGSLCDKHDILLICDDVQVGCGRTGPFFSFERAGIQPDIIILSKAISGYGLPMAIVLMKPELDLWRPGEHNGTFRGNQLAFVGGSAALDYRLESNLEANMKEKELCVKAYLENEVQPINERIRIRGIGLIWGIDLAAFGNTDLAARITARCFERGLIIERAGSQGQVIKLLPALNIETSVLREGCQLLGEALKENPDLHSGSRLKIRKRIKKN